MDNIHPAPAPEGSRHLPSCVGPLMRSVHPDVICKSALPRVCDVTHSAHVAMREYAERWRERRAIQETVRAALQQTGFRYKERGILLDTIP
jgi:hypothetical protein